MLKQVLHSAGIYRLVAGLPDIVQKQDRLLEFVVEHEVSSGELKFLFSPQFRRTLVANQVQGSEQPTATA
jgi:hypothetical protein